MALPSVPPSNLIVNIVCGRGRIRSSVLPEKFKDARVRFFFFYMLLLHFHINRPQIFLTIGILVLAYQFNQLLTLVLDNIPMVSPYNMEKTGPLAFK